MKWDEGMLMAISNIKTWKNVKFCRIIIVLLISKPKINKSQFDWLKTYIYTSINILYSDAATVDFFFNLNKQPRKMSGKLEALFITKLQ